MLHAFLLSMLFIVSPIQRRESRCMTSCITDPRIPWAIVCFYDVRRCEWWEQECVDSRELVCRPIVVNLGAWDPIPFGYVPDRGY